ncbi:cbb3-type cytochrome c oxidase N-terminal domain-containing protein [Hymenobacter canadensis]|uniref:C-type cytochrome n=1 Tax=Hymenobacter canadensis TaxID=2999067 RepID=A0ABY7LRG7_9BACT|nr:cbb3-type cytochrome c oxidase N-terminal domain-containing protein [Hymenobacter canadensis]WBA43010.1 c-type cytochrome [Hymenobacter canadensis]
MLTKRTVLLSILGLLIGYAAAGQSAAAAPAAATTALTGQQVLFWVLLGLLGLLLIVLLLTLVGVVVQMKPQLRQLYELPTVHDTWSGQVLGLLVGDARLVQGEVRDELMDHEYDGIHEFDNDLPPWWKYGFYLTILIAIGYVGYYHVLQAGPLQTAEYAVEMQQAALFVPVGSDDPNQVTTYQVLTASADLGSGKDLFQTNCAACHGTSGEGKVGPNLTDEFWLHGGEVNHVYKTIKFGVNGKGMVAWKGKLSSKQMLQVSSYVLSLQGTKPANAKEPQGEKEATTKTVAGL